MTLSEGNQYSHHLISESSQRLEELLRTSRGYDFKKACVVEYVMEELKLDSSSAESPQKNEKHSPNEALPGIQSNRREIGEEGSTTAYDVVELTETSTSAGTENDIERSERVKDETEEVLCHDPTVGSVEARGVAEKVSEEALGEQKHLTCGHSGAHRHLFHTRPLPKEQRIVPILLQRFRETSATTNESSSIEQGDWRIGVIIDEEIMVELFFFHMHFQQDRGHPAERGLSKLCECCLHCAEFEIFTCRMCSRQICGRCTNKMACHLCRGSTHCPFVASPKK